MAEDAGASEMPHRIAIALIYKAGSLFTDSCFHPAKIHLSHNGIQWDLAVASRDGHGNASLRAKREPAGTAGALSETCFRSFARRDQVFKHNPEALSVIRSMDRNRALAHFLKSFGNLRGLLVGKPTL